MKPSNWWFPLRGTPGSFPHSLLSTSKLVFMQGFLDGVVWLPGCQHDMNGFTGYSGQKHDEPVTGQTCKLQ